MSTARKLLHASIALMAACADVPQPFDLDHARVLAVRVEPPALAPGETAHVDALVTDASAIPRIAAVGDVEIALPAGATALGLARTADGWTLTAPDAATLAAARAAIGAAADAPLVVPLTLTLTTPDATLVATKVVALGVHADNPPAPQILRDGTRQAIALTVGVEAGLIVEGALPDHAYRWFSSVGDLVGYTRAEATVTPAIATTGWIVVVDRDATGGTAWTIAPATVGDVR